MKSFRPFIIKTRQTFSTILKITERLDEIKINQGLILSALNEQKTSLKLKDYEFKVFSQFGEDGIIQHLIKAIAIENKTFIEFGVEDFYESNCRFLLMKDGWKGFVIDGSASNIERLKHSYFYWKYQLGTLAAFITRDNINELLAKSDFAEDLGIMSIDLDGNDYFILEAIKGYQPRILICEYNDVFGPQRKVSIPYQPDFNRTKPEYLNLYWGASLSAMTHVATRKGYALVGTNRGGNNAFFVRRDLLNDKAKELSVDEAYAPSSYRESTDLYRNLTHLTGDERLNAIKASRFSISRRKASR